MNATIIEVPEEKEKEKVEERWFKEIIAENFRNLWKVIDIEIKEALKLQVG